MEMRSVTNADQRITYVEVQAHCDLYGMQLEPDEVEILFACDRAWSSQYNEERDRFRGDK